MKKTLPNEALAKAIAEYPTLRAFADALDVRYQVVQQWLLNGTPAEYCPRIEKLLQGRVRCEELNSRVDWAYLRGTEAPADHCDPVAPDQIKAQE